MGLLSVRQSLAIGAAVAATAAAQSSERVRHSLDRLGLGNIPASAVDFFLELWVPPEEQPKSAATVKPARRSRGRTKQTTKPPWGGGGGNNTGGGKRRAGRPKQPNTRPETGMAQQPTAGASCPSEAAPTAEQRARATVVFSAAAATAKATAAQNRALTTARRRADAEIDAAAAREQCETLSWRVKNAVRLRAALSICRPVIAPCGHRQAAFIVDRDWLVGRLSQTLVARHSLMEELAVAEDSARQAAAQVATLAARQKLEVLAAARLLVDVGH
eukprot:SAG11_NODE_1279_length_5314_cov_3.403835_5_plen_274_part_00